MRPSFSAKLVPYALLALLILAPLTSVSGRSVHETNSVDLLPQGEFTQASDWALDAYTSFSEEPAVHTESMVADDRLTLVHERPLNLDQMVFWAQTTPTDSNNSLYAPDGSYSWSSGPEMELTNFNAAGSTQYAISDVSLVFAFAIPNALSQDSIRFSLEYNGNFTSLSTISHTQGAMDYMSGTYWRENITNLDVWTWSSLQNLIVTANYESVGTSDDSQLNLDAVGVEVTMQTPWYGGEVAEASTVYNAHETPVLVLDLTAGDSSNMGYASCGLQTSTEGATGQWTSSIIETPPNQRIGRVHYTLENESLDDVVLEYASSSDGTSFTAFESMNEHMLLPDQAFTKVRVSTIDACISEITVDVNDPTLTLNGRIFGDLDGLDPTYSRWLLFVNDELVTNQPVELSPSLSLSFPIGAHLHDPADPLQVQLKTWFTWDSQGTASTTAFEVSSISITGGYSVAWDEDPTCIEVGDQSLIEDGGGRILPFLHRCTDDRTTNENLVVSFTNTNTNLVEVDLTEGDVRVRLMADVSGFATITTTVLDEAGNRWSEVFMISVSAVDDAPSLTEFQSIIPVQLSVPTSLGFTYTDIDSNDLTASTNRSWAAIDMDARTITVNAPAPGFHSVLVSICDQSSCTERTMDLEVMALPDLLIESIDAGDDTAEAGDVTAIRVFVRNNGQADASLISVRCEMNTELVDIGILPILKPGELGVVTCDWAVPEETGMVQFRAVVDRGLEIDEGDETNNEAIVAVDIRPSSSTSDQASSGLQVSDGVFYGLSVLGLLAIIGLFGYLAPAKIKKLE
ncbi:MAG: CARDB domain-containing protein [Euryarchaeota archaeon]